MNNCLADLSKLIPAHYMKKGRGRVEKTEIIESAIKHLKDLIEFTNAQQRQQEQQQQQQQSQQEQQPPPSPPPLSSQQQHLQHQQQPLQLQPPQNNQQTSQQLQLQQQQSQSTITNSTINSFVPTSPSGNDTSSAKTEFVGYNKEHQLIPSTSRAKQNGIPSAVSTVFKHEHLQTYPKNHQENNHRDSSSSYVVNCDRDSCSTKNHDKIHRSSPSSSSSSSGSGSDSSSSSSSSSGRGCSSSSSSSSISSLSSNGSNGCCTCDTNSPSNIGSNSSSRSSFNSTTTCNSSSHQKTIAWYKKAWLVRSFSRSPQR